MSENSNVDLNDMMGGFTNYADGTDLNDMMTPKSDVIANVGTTRTKEDFADSPKRGASETAALNQQAQTGTMALSNIENDWLRGAAGFSYNTGLAKAADEYMANNAVELARGIRKTLTGTIDLKSPDADESNIDYMIDAMGANGIGGYFKRFLGLSGVRALRGDDNIIEQWEKSDGYKYDDPYEHKMAKLAWAQELASGIVGQNEQMKINARAELEGRDSSWLADVGTDVIEQGGYTFGYLAGALLPGGAATTYGVPLALATAQRSGELEGDKLDVDKNGDVRVAKEGDSMKTALGKGVVGAAGEVAIESVGGAMTAKGLGMLGRKTLGKIPVFKIVGGKMSQTAVGRALDKYWRLMGHIGHMTGVQSFPEEYIEEAEQSLLDAALGVTRRDSELEGTTVGSRIAEDMGEFFSADQQKKLVQSLLVMQFLQGGAAKVKDVYDSKYREFVKKTDSKFGGTVDKFDEKTGIGLNEVVDKDGKKKAVVATDIHNRIQVKQKDGSVATMEFVKGIDGLLSEEVGVDKKELKYYTFEEKCDALQAWMEGLDEAKVKGWLDDSTKYVNELLKKMNEAGRYKMTAPNADLANKENLSLDKDFSAPVQTVDNLNREVLRRVANVGDNYTITVDMWKDPSGIAGFSVRDNYNRILSATNLEEANAKANEMLADAKENNAKLDAINEMRKRVGSNAIVVTGPTFSALKQRVNQISAKYGWSDEDRNRIQGMINEGARSGGNNEAASENIGGQQFIFLPTSSIRNMDDVSRLFMHEGAMHGGFQTMFGEVKGDAKATSENAKRKEEFMKLMKEDSELNTDEAVAYANERNFSGASPIDRLDRFLRDSWRKTTGLELPLSTREARAWAYDMRKSFDAQNDGGGKTFVATGDQYEQTTKQSQERAVAKQKIQNKKAERHNEVARMFQNATLKSGQKALPYRVERNTWAAQKVITPQPTEEQLKGATERNFKESWNRDPATLLAALNEGKKDGAKILEEMKDKTRETENKVEEQTKKIETNTKDDELQKFKDLNAWLGEIHDAKDGTAVMMVGSKVRSALWDRYEELKKSGYKLDSFALSDNGKRTVSFKNADGDVKSVEISSTGVEMKDVVTKKDDEKKPKAKKITLQELKKRHGELASELVDAISNKNQNDMRAVDAKFNELARSAVESGLQFPSMESINKELDNAIADGRLGESADWLRKSLNKLSDWVEQENAKNGVKGVRWSKSAPRGLQKQFGVEYPSATSEEIDAVIKPIPGVRWSMGKKAREDAKALLIKKRPDLLGDDVDALIRKREQYPDAGVLTEDPKIRKELEDEIYGKFVDEIGKFATPKEQKAALHWFIKGAIRLPEDAPKVTEAIKYGERAKGKANTDPMSYDSPMAMIDALHEFKPKGRAIDPDKVATLKQKKEMGNGVTVYTVMDGEHIRLPNGKQTVQGQLDMREIINTHWGEDANPWCLLQGDGHGNLSDDAWHYWNHYNALPKRVAFKDGKLLAFMATDGGLSDIDDMGEYIEEYYFPEFVDEYCEYLKPLELKGQDYDSFDSWMRKNHRDEIDARMAEYLASQPEQWWDRKDASHEGIPLGNMPVPGDKFGRWADFEIRDGEFEQIGGYQKGEPNQNGRIEWYANGNIAQKIDANLLLNWNENGGLEKYREKDTDGATIKVFDYDENGYPIFASEGGINTDFTEDGEFEKGMRAEAERIYRENSQKNETRWSFIGKRGADRINLTGRDEAVQMEKDGKSREEIWRATGWWKGPDKRWRVEVDVSKESAKEVTDYMLKHRSPLSGYFRINGYKNHAYFRLEDVIKNVSETARADFQMLIDAYPQLGQKPIIMLKGSGAGGHSANDHIWLNKKWADDWKVFDEDYELASCLLHEIQHTIQDIEGFGRGGSGGTFSIPRDRTLGPAARELVSEFKISGRKIGRDLYYLLQDLAMMGKPNHQIYRGEREFARDVMLVGYYRKNTIPWALNSLVTAANERYANGLPPIDEKTALEKMDFYDTRTLFGKTKEDVYMSKYIKVGEIAKKYGFKDADELIDGILQDMLANNSYYRLTGEAESRLVETRMMHSEKWRMENPPWEDFDIDEASQVGGAQRSEPKALPGMKSIPSVGGSGIANAVRWSKARAQQLIKDGDAMYYKTRAVDQNFMRLLTESAVQMMQMKGYLDKHEKALNLPKDIEGNTLFDNGSYNKSEEPTSICERTIPFEIVLDYTAKILKRPLTQLEAMYVNQHMGDIMEEPSCFYCYIALDRALRRETFGKYLDARDAMLKKFDEGMSLKKAYKFYVENFTTAKDLNAVKKARVDMWYAAWKNGDQMLTPNDLATDANIEKARKASESMKRQIEDAEEYNRGTSKAKKMIPYRAYDGHLLKMSQKTVDELNSHYGLRFYSFSDGSPAFVLEDMERIRDASIRGLKGLAYTKMLWWVDTFAPTNININISVKGTPDGKGGYMCDGMYGADWDGAKKRRDTFRNVGITYVAMTDDEVRWALNQDWVDTVIPFHTVFTPDRLPKYMGWDNHKMDQSDVKGKEWTKDNAKSVYPPDHKNLVSEYFKRLNENNLEPRLASFLDEPNYMKLVNETRLSTEESLPLVPDFNTEAAYPALAKFEKRGGYGRLAGYDSKFYKDFAKKMAKGIKAGEMPKPDPKYVVGEDGKKEIRWSKFEMHPIGAVYSNSAKQQPSPFVVEAANASDARVKAFKEMKRRGYKSFRADWEAVELPPENGIMTGDDTKKDTAEGAKPLPGMRAKAGDRVVRAGAGADGTDQNAAGNEDGRAVLDDGEGSGETLDYDESYTELVNSGISPRVAERMVRKGVRLDHWSKRNVTPAEDAAYMDAVKRGDMETAQKMVREAAAKAMPNTKVVDKDGLPLAVYHGTKSDFTVFDPVKAGSVTGGNYGTGFYFSKDKNIADFYGSRSGGKTLECYIDSKKVAKPYDSISSYRKFVEEVGMDFDNDVLKRYEEMERTGEFGNRNEDLSISDLIADTLYTDKNTSGGKDPMNILSQKASEKGYDAIDVFDGNEIIVLDPNVIKSADPVTYDENGNVIPLSERFNAEKDDIRWSKRSKFRPNPLAQHMADFLKDAVGANEHANARAAKMRMNEIAKWMNRYGNKSPDEVDFTARVAAAGSLSPKAIKEMFADKKGMKAFFNRFREKVQDADLILKRLDELLGVTDKEKSAYYQRDRNYGMIEKYKDEFDREIYQPLLEAVAKLRKEYGEDAYNELKYTLLALHGAERNRMIAERSATVKKLLNDPKMPIAMKDAIWAYVNGTANSLQTVMTQMAEMSDVFTAQDRANLVKELEGSGASTAAWEAGLKDLESKGFIRRDANGNVVGGKAKAAIDLMRQMTQRTRDMLVQSGRLSQAQADLWEQLSPNYVPMRDNMDSEFSWVQKFLWGEQTDEAAYTKSYKGTEFHHAMGRSTIADDPIYFAIQQWQNAVSRSMDNVARRVLADEIRTSPKGIDVGTVFWMPDDQKRRDLFAKVNGGTATVDEQREFDEMQNSHVALPMRRIIDGTGTVREVPDVQAIEQTYPNIVAFKENGDLKFIRLGGFDVADVVRNGKLSDSDANRIGSAVKKSYAKDLWSGWGKIRKATAVFSMLRTAYSPTFVLTNFLADRMQGYRNIYADFGGEGVAEFSKWQLKAFKSAKMILTGQFDNSEEGRMAKEWFDNGGKIGGMATSTFVEIEKNFTRDLKDLENKAKGFKSAKQLGTWLRSGSKLVENLNELVEMSTRIAAYATAKKITGSVADAISYSRDITVNFNRKGEWTPIMNALYAFSNASIQDIHRTGLSLVARHGVGMVVGTAILGWILSALGYGQDDPEDEKQGKDQYKYRREYMKQNQMGMRIGDHVWSVPIRGAMRLPFYLGEKIHEVMFGKADVGTAAKDVVQLAVDSATDVIGATESPLQSVAPSVVRPLVEAAENQTFNGSKIARDPMNERQVRSNMGRGTTGTVWKNLAWALNRMTGGNDVRRGLVDYQPEWYQHWLSSIAGSLGRDLGQTASFVTDIANTAIDGKNRMNVKNTPFLSRMASTLGENSAKYHEIENEYRTKLQEFNSLDRNQQEEFAQDVPFLARKNRRWAKDLDDLAKTANRLIKEEMKETDVDKREALHQLRLRAQYLFITRMDSDPSKDTAENRMYERRSTAEADRIVKRAKAARELEEKRRKRVPFMPQK